MAKRDADLVEEVAARLARALGDLMNEAVEHSKDPTSAYRMQELSIAAVRWTNTVRNARRVKKVRK